MTQNFVQKHQFFQELVYVAPISRPHGLGQIRCINPIKGSVNGNFKQRGLRKMTIASYPQTTKEIYKKNFIPFPFPNLDQELCKIKMK